MYEDYCLDMKKLESVSKYQKKNKKQKTKKEQKNNRYHHLTTSSQLDLYLSW